MRVTVYSLRRLGRKLPREEVLASGVVGWLRLGKLHPSAPPEIHAWLLSQPDGQPGFDELSPSLRFVSIQAVERGGMLLRGQDPIQNWRPPVHTQAW